MLIKLYNIVSSGLKLVENDRKLGSLLKIPSSEFQQSFLWKLLEALLCNHKDEEDGGRKLHSMFPEPLCTVIIVLR